MRRAFILLGGIALAACQAVAPAASAPTGVAVASTATPTSSHASASVSATPAPTHGGSTAVHLPVTQCQTTVGAGAVDSPPPTKAATIPSPTQGRLAAYGDGYDLLLAPKGWWCQAQIGADGSSSVRVWPSGDQQAQVMLITSGACQGCAYGTACSLFEAAAVQNAADYGPCSQPRPAREEVTAETASLIAFADPPGVTGTGDGSGGAYGSSGILWFDAGGQMAQASKLTCTASPADQDLCPAILADYEASLPSPAPGAGMAKIAPVGGVPAPAPAATAAQAGDCAIRVDQRDATVVFRGAGDGVCESAKHSLLQIGLFATVRPDTATNGLRLLCKGVEAGSQVPVEVWDSGSGVYGTEVCQGWNLVAP